MRPSPSFRLWFLGVVNGLILLHVVLYYVFHRTSVGCIDFFGLATVFGMGRVTAGTLFIGALVLTTLAFGRVFCGWGCHFAFFQDLLSKVFRSRGVHIPFRRSWLELIIPPILFTLTLLYPIVNWQRDMGFPEALSIDLSYPDVWHLLPGLKGVLLILLVDVVALTLLFGDRAFCRYICPYGLFLKFFHAASPTRVVKTSQCSNCESCGGACPTGVPIKHEIEAFGGIRDLNCMNCGDCVAACPDGALQLRPTKMAYTGGPSRVLPVHVRRFSTELIMLSCTVAGLFVYRGREFGDFLAAGMGMTVGAIMVVALKPASILAGRRLARSVREYVRFGAIGLAVYMALGMVGQYIGNRAISRGERFMGAGEYESTWQAYSSGRRFASVFWPFTFYLDDYDDRARRQVPPLEERADDAMKEARWTEAEWLCRAVIAADPTRVSACGNLGTALMKQGDFWAAAIQYMEVLRYDPDDLVALYHLAMVRIQLGQLKEAVHLVERIFSIDTVGNTYDLIRGNPLFQLLESEPGYRQAVVKYRPGGRLIREKEKPR